MKIICIEEHVSDKAISLASLPGLLLEAGYARNFGKAVTQAPTDISRPMLNSMKIATEEAKDLGAGRIEAMDAHGVTMQVLSNANSIQLAPGLVAASLARAANDRLAEAVRANPARFAGFATLPWQKPDAAAQELERSVKELGMVGTLLAGRPGETFLDDKRYEPVLSKLNELRVPIYVHPGFILPQVQKPYYGGLNEEIIAALSMAGWGWHNEAGVQVIRMIFSGMFEKFPNLQIISGHWGEMVPFYLQRMDDNFPKGVPGLSKTITETYKAHVYVTPSGMLNLPHFEFIYKVVGADRLIFSIDYPYATLSGSREFLESLPISDLDKEKFAHKNAEALFGFKP